jgi:5'-nucleotidase
MRVLIVNDDGVNADGLLALYHALAAHHDVTAVAPERQRSAAGHAITLHKPLRLSKSHLKDGTPAFSSNGTPSDCATLGIHEAMGDKVDLVISGINHGPNMGWDVHYSGTISAAIEASIIGVQAFGISVASFDDDIHWDTAAQFAVRLAEYIVANPLPQYTVFNVNVPNVPKEEIRGVSIASLGRRQYVDCIEKRTDPRGQVYYWLGGSLSDERGHDEPGTDVSAVGDNMIAVTPLQLDMTAHDLLPGLRSFDW